MHASFVFDSASIYIVSFSCIIFCVNSCYVLVDCTRGQCEEDKGLLRYLHRNKLRWQVLLTKSDLLRASDLAACIIAVDRDLQEMFARPVNAPAAAEPGNTINLPNIVSYFFLFTI